MIKLISQVIADFASGEISQQEYQFDTDLTLQQYLDKSFYKTATLIAASCKSAAAFSDVPVEVSRCLASIGPDVPLRLAIRVHTRPEWVLCNLLESRFYFLGMGAKQEG